MKLRNIFAVALAGLAFTACSNDDVPNTGIEEGGTAYVGLDLTLPANAFSKAADATDTNAEASETKVSKVTVYGQAQGGAATPVAKLADLTADDFTKTDNQYALKEAKAIKVKGQVDSKMNIYVVLNSTEDLSSKLIGTPPTAHAAAASANATKDNFLMSNAEAGVATLKATTSEAIAAGAKAVVTVERAVAKILVKASNAAGANLDLVGKFEDSGNTGKFEGSSIRWAVGNSPKSLYIRKYNDGGTIKSPDYAYKKGDAYDDYVAKYDVLTDKDGVPTVEPAIQIMPTSVSSATGYDSGTSYVGYSNENIHDTYVAGNTTYVLLMAKFIPTTTYENLTGTGASMNGTDANVTVAQTFWYHNPSNRYVTDAAHTTYIGTNPSEADNFVGPYTDGKCYYKIPVWDVTSDITKAKGTERNTFYTLSVKSLTAPGKPTDTSVTEPNTPTEDPDSYIGVDITIAKWATASMGDDIELK